MGARDIDPGEWVLVAAVTCKRTALSFAPADTIEERRWLRSLVQSFAKNGEAG